MHVWFGKTWVYFSSLFEVQIRMELLRNAAMEGGAALRSAAAVWFLSCNILLPSFSCVVASSPGSGLHCCSGAGQVDLWEQVELTNSVARSEDVGACLTSASPAMLPLLKASKTPGTAVCPNVEVIPYLYELLLSAGWVGKQDLSLHATAGAATSASCRLGAL